MSLEYILVVSAVFIPPVWRDKSNQSRMGTYLGLGKAPIVVVSNGAIIFNPSTENSIFIFGFYTVKAKPLKPLVSGVSGVSGKTKSFLKEKHYKNFVFT
jgi:hypothetical protein